MTIPLFKRLFSVRFILIVPSETQSRQSAKLFLQSLELGLPHPLTRRRVCTVPAQVRNVTLCTLLFWSQMVLASLVGIQGPKKSWFPGPTPSNAPRNGSCPPQNHYLPRHINKRYITCYSYEISLSCGILRKHYREPCLDMATFSIGAYLDIPGIECWESVQRQDCTGRWRAGFCFLLVEHRGHFCTFLYKKS